MCTVSAQLGLAVDLFLSAALSSRPKNKLVFLPKISLPFSTAFGADTEGSQWVVGYLLQKVISNLSVWSGEQDLANDTVQLLVTLVERRER